MVTLIQKLSIGALVAVFAAAPVFALANTDTNRGFSPRSVGSPLEVIISDNGNAIVRGAKVTDVSGSTITAQTIWDASSITWSVRTDNDTDFVRKSGGGASIDDIADGDYISFSGHLTSGSSFTVDADVVKNWSATENRSAVVGTVTDVDDNEFTLQTVGRGTVTVKVSSSTDFSGSIDELSDLSTNIRVVAYGTYNADTHVLTATEVSTQGKIKADKDDHRPLQNWGQFLKGFRLDFWNHKK